MTAVLGHVKPSLGDLLPWWLGTWPPAGGLPASNWLSSIQRPIAQARSLDSSSEHSRQVDPDGPDAMPGKVSGVVQGKFIPSKPGKS